VLSLSQFFSEPGGRKCFVQHRLVQPDARVQKSAASSHHTRVETRKSSSRGVLWHVFSHFSCGELPSYTLQCNYIILNIHL